MSCSTFAPLSRPLEKGEANNNSVEMQRWVHHPLFWTTWSFFGKEKVADALIHSRCPQKKNWGLLLECCTRAHDFAIIPGGISGHSNNFFFAIDQSLGEL